MTGTSTSTRSHPPNDAAAALLAEISSVSIDKVGTRRNKCLGNLHFGLV